MHLYKKTRTAGQGGRETIIKIEEDGGGNRRDKNNRNSEKGEMK